MSAFIGFESPNFTQIPNEYLDYTIAADCQLSKTQMRIMNLFFRETFGWQDKNRSIILSFNDILAILGLTKRNTVIDALKGLVEEEKFLECIQVCDLPESVRANIETSLDRTLQPKQKLYRLNLAERKNKSWDFAERTHINVKERKIQSSNQKVTTLKSSNQKVTTFESGNQKDTTEKDQKVTTFNPEKVTTLEPESLGTLGVDESLNKGLNKDLNKKEEEEEGASFLLDNPLLKYLNDSSIKTGFSKDDSMEIVSQVNDMKIVNLTEKVIDDSLSMVEDELNRNYIKGNVVNWTAVKIQKIANGPKLNIEPKSPENPENPKNPKNPKKPQIKYGTDKGKLDFKPHTRTEMVPEWVAEVEREWIAAQQKEAAAKLEVDEKERKRKLEENLKKLRA